MPPAKKPAEGLTDSWGRRNNRKLLDHICAECGAVFRPAKATANYCSVPCARKKNGGWNRKDESWSINAKGYVAGRVWTEDGTRRNVKHHRVVVERLIGRLLPPHVDVHHIDGNKQNNDPENLQVLSHSAHSRLTNAERIYRKGYRLNLSDEERQARSERMRRMRAKARKP